MKQQQESHDNLAHPEMGKLEEDIDEIPRSYILKKKITYTWNETQKLNAQTFWKKNLES